MRAALLFCAALLLVGCVRTVTAVCPAIVEYTPGQQAEAVDEILALPSGSIVERMLLDYGELRDRLRACSS